MVILNPPYPSVEIGDPLQVLRKVWFKFTKSPCRKACGPWWGGHIPPFLKVAAGGLRPS